MTLLDRRGTWSPEDRAENQCATVGFEIPHGVGAFRVELEYERRDGAVLDLGCEGPDGYVGWSGGARSHFLVSEELVDSGLSPDPGTAGDVAGARRAAPGSATGGRLPADRPGGHRRRGGGGAGCSARGATVARTRAAPGAPGRRRDAVAGRRLPRPHAPLGRRPRDRGARRPGREPWSRRAGGDRPQHDQPSRIPALGGGALRHPADPRAGGHDRPRARERVGRHRVRRLPQPRCAVATRRRGPWRSPVGEPPAGDGLLLADDPRPPDGRRGDLALVVARAAGAAQLGWPAGVVAVLGPRDRTDRRERLPRIRQRRSARCPDDMGPHRRATTSSAG